MNEFEMLKLENQICFPLYAASKAVTRMHQPYLAELNLTYTQYMVMATLWQAEVITMKELSKEVLLDSGTLTPLVKKLEKKQLVTRQRSASDERVLIVTLTNAGRELEQIAKKIPEKLAQQAPEQWQDVMEIQRLSAKLLGNIQKGENFRNYLSPTEQALLDA